MSPTSKTMSWERLHAFALASFQAAGFSAEESQHGADVLLWASLRGVDTHGIRNLKRYYVDSSGGVGQRDGVIRPQSEITTDRESETSATWNANGALGLSVSVRAMRHAMAKAASHGFGAVAVRNSTHFGAAGYYAHMAVAEDMIGFASTGYLFPHGQEKAVVPFGGLLPMLSTNPVAIAAPCGKHPPFVLDMATSVVPVNRIEMKEELEQAIPLGWALDDQHQPTDTPAAVDKVEPLGGATAFGGHKGYGLAIASWILTGLLSGAWRQNPPTDRILGTKELTEDGFAQEGVAHCFAAIRIDQFCEPEQFRQGLDTMMDVINASPPAEGFERVVVAGQHEDATERQRRQEGVPLSPSTVDDLRSISEKYSIPLEFD